MKSVFFVSLGCPKNLIDSEIMVGTLIRDGFKIAESEEDADIIVVNTCGFIEDAKKESIAKIFEMSEFKNRKLKTLVVAGCLTQRYKDELLDELPEVDVFIGTGEFQNISRILKDVEAGKAARTYYNLPTYLQEENAPRINSQLPHRAYIKISEGCLKRCAFCAIPKIRGNLQSRPISEVVNEAKRLAQSGVKELNIISHDFTDYGWDLRKTNSKCEETPENLLRALSEISELKWIRILYLYPDGISSEMIHLIKERKNLVKYFDMPLQHINNDVLKRMNRHMNREEIEKILEEIRKEIPSAVIRTQFIVGFPGETEEQFNELLDFIKVQQFDRVGCFVFSQEEGTASAEMPDQVDEKVKQHRYEKVMKIQQRISKQKHKKFVGNIVDVLVEGLSDETDLLLQGRMSTQAPEIDGVVLINDGEAKVGEFVKVKITDSMDYDLVGTIQT